MRAVDAMIPLDEALAIVDDTLATVRLPAETLPVRDALGRTLLLDATSRLDLPPFNKSAMDGYAILADDERHEYRLLGTVAAGEVASVPLAPGTTVRVMTGAPVPPGAGKVVMQEDTQADGDIVRVLEHRNATNICWQGEDVRTGDVVMPRGTTLTATDLANLVSCGLTEVTVSRRPRLAIISTGDEIVDSPDLLEPGKIMDANGPLLAALAREFGLDVVGESSFPDDQQAIAQGIRSALSQADIVVLSGGVSVGQFDFVVEALRDAGLRVHFCRVAVKPGKPITYASGEGGIAFGLPGNPVSAYVGFHLFVLRAAARIAGAEPGMRRLTLQLATAFTRRAADRAELVPASLSEIGTVEPVEFHGSAHLAALTRADGLFLVPRGVNSLPAGHEVAFMPLMRRRP